MTNSNSRSLNRDASYSAYFDREPLEVNWFALLFRSRAVECASSPSGNVADGRWFAACARTMHATLGQRLHA